VIALKQDDAAALVSGREIITCAVEFYRADDIGCLSVFDRPQKKPHTLCDIVDIALIAEASKSVSQDTKPYNV
jgi:hypothetical protein